MIMIVVLQTFEKTCGILKTSVFPVRCRKLFSTRRMIISFKEATKRRRTITENFKTMVKFFLIVLFVYTVFVGHNLANALFFTRNWDTLRVTWGLNIFRKHVFELMPMTESDAKDQGYTKINSECKGKFLGWRYMKPGDISLILIYDVNGYLAGIQASYPEDAISPSEFKHWFTNSPLLIEETVDGKRSLTATAYYVDPNIICTTGRTEKEYQANPAGTELSIQKGYDPIANLIKIPKSENQVEAKGWTKGRCFPSMGNHYWFNTSKDMNCDNFLPAFLLYNSGSLTGFGFAIPNMFHSVHYEHPTKAVFPKFFAEVPDCLNAMYDKAQGFSTMHIYMNVKIWNIICV